MLELAQKLQLLDPPVLSVPLGIAAELRPGLIAFARTVAEGRARHSRFQRSG